MSHFITEADRKEIHADWWAEGETVTIERFTYVDEQRIFGLAAVGTPTTDDEGNTRVKLDMALWSETRLVLGVLSWTFVDAEGEPVPCDSEHKCALNPQDGAFIEAGIRELNKERTAEEQRNF